MEGQLWDFTYVLFFKYACKLRDLTAAIISNTRPNIQNEYILYNKDNKWPTHFLYFDYKHFRLYKMIFLHLRLRKIIIRYVFVN